ncbi:hypothetical protein KHQ88_06290 [Mycoplasmatota bacterium]|nr:hypothetical protein KHQ88_06290 [Mycoplasmatota bacterium]
MIVEIDVEAIKDLIDKSLSLPIVYNVGRYYVYGSSSVKKIYLGQGFDDELVFIVEDFQKGTVEILYSY